MKKLMFFILLSGFYYTLASAQNLSVGLRAGVMASSYWKSKDADSGNRLLTRPQIGVLVAYPLTDRLTLQAELNYAPKGDAWYFDHESGHREEIRDVYNYLEIPILVKYYILKNPLHVYVIGGAYIAHALSNHYTEDGKAYDVSFTKGDVGIQLGGGAAMPIGPGKVFAELRLAQGLKNLDVFEDETVTRLIGFGLSIGWMMDLK